MAFRYSKAGEVEHLVVDATSESGRLARLVSHASPGTKACNCRPQVVVFKGKPRLILRATRDIKKGEEIAYDYGDRRPSALKAFLWLAKSKENKETESESEKDSESDSV